MWWMVIFACVTKSEQAQAERCVAALLELDADGDGAIPSDAAPPAACDEEMMVEVADRNGFGLDDCDDQDPDRFVGNPEQCGDGVDQDCDGEDPEPAIWYADQDDDDFGDADDYGTMACDQPENTVSDNTDCDDGDAEVNPEAEAEAVCGDDLPASLDQNCDGIQTCAVSQGLVATSFVTLAAGAGAALAADDGLVVIGGSDDAWILSADRQRKLSAEELSLSFSGADEAGADVAISDGVVLVGAPRADVGCLIGDTSTTCVDGGSLAAWSDSGSVGYLDGDISEGTIGLGFAAEAGVIAVGRFSYTTWSFHLVSSEDLPESGTRLSLADVDGAIISSVGDRSYTPPSVSIASADGAVIVAVGQPEDSITHERAKLYTVDGDTVALCCAVTSDSETFGTSVLLMDLDGSGSLDLLVSAPDEDLLYLFLDPTGDLSTSDADLTFTGTSQTGLSLANAGDINGDGQDDLLVGAEDTAYLFLGGELSVPWEPYATLEGDRGSQLGADLAGADLDQDGYSDLILGAPGDGGVYVLWGGPP